MRVPQQALIKLSGGLARKDVHHLEPSGHLVPRQVLATMLNERRLEVIAARGDTDEIRRALFDLVAQIRGEKPAGVPALRVVSNR